MGREIRVGCEFHLVAAAGTPAILQVEPRHGEPARILSERWHGESVRESESHRDVYGNRFRRVVLPEGEVVFGFDAEVEVPNGPDPIDADAREVTPSDLPPDALLFTLPSRYCLSDALCERAWELFGGVAAGWSRVQAICDWVHENLRFQYGSSTPLTTCVDALDAGAGVCRDFAHLGITFCRALNIPARYVFGYLPDIDVPPPSHPMDFCAWMEVYLGDGWWTFDPRNNERRTGRVVIGRGRDAVDVAMVTSYGPLDLKQMTVWADELPAGAQNAARRDDKAP